MSASVARTVSGARSRRDAVSLAVRKRPSQLQHPGISPYFLGLYGTDIPIDRLAQTNLKWGCGSEPKLPFCTANVQTPPRLAIWLARVPDDPSREACDFCNHCRQIADLKIKEP